jgi:hypothetical protein
MELLNHSVTFETKPVIKFYNDKKLKKNGALE